MSDKLGDLRVQLGRAAAMSKELANLLSSLEERFAMLEKDKPMEPQAPVLRHDLEGFTPTPKLEPPTKQEPKKRTLADMQNAFPQELRALLDFEDGGSYFIVKPIIFLNDNFKPIVDIIRGLDGEYVSAGRDSHFKIPKETSGK